MVDKARLFVPLPMNPLHRHLDKDSTQSTTSVTKEITVLPWSHNISSSGPGYVSSSGRTKHPPSQPKSTSHFTIIEIIEPDNQKHESEFVPAFAQPPMIVHDSSLELATLMNLRPLRAFTSYTSIASSSVLASPPFQSHHQVSRQSAISSSGQLQSPHQLTHQQSSHDDSDSESSFTSETDNTVTLNTPGSSLHISTLTKLKVVFWVNELRRYLFLWETSRMNNVHAAELHQLLCKIEDKMADPFLTPQTLGETSLGKVMKSFTHGALDARLKEVARHVVGYWRKVCLEA